MISAENSIPEPPNLKILGGRITPDSPTRLVPSVLTIMPPVTKNLAPSKESELTVIKLYDYQ